MVQDENYLLNNRCAMYVFIVIMLYWLLNSNLHDVYFFVINCFIKICNKLILLK